MSNAPTIVCAVAVLSLRLIPASVSLPLLAGWESLIGFGLLVGRGLRGILLLLYVQRRRGWRLPVAKDDTRQSSATPE
jgi:hypothetical protein